MLLNLTIIVQVHDRMTECVYASKLTSFETSAIPEPVYQVPVMKVIRA